MKLNILRETLKQEIKYACLKLNKTLYDRET